VTKFCNGCKRELPLDAFHRTSDPKRKDGRVSRCKKCRAEYDANRKKDPLVRKRINTGLRAWRKQNRDTLYDKNRGLKRRLPILLIAAKKRARRKSIEYGISEIEKARLLSVLELGKCELTGTSFNLAAVRGPDTPSLDRINPDVGYVDGNVRIICHAINCGIGTWGFAELLRVLNLQPKGDSVIIPTANKELGNGTN